MLKLYLLAMKFFEQNDQDDVCGKDQHGRQCCLEEEISDHAVAGAFQRVLQMKDDLVHIDITPCGKSPSAGKANQRHKGDKDPRDNIENCR